MIFDNFLKLFEKTGNYYIPKDISDNKYRHFGCKLNNLLYLSKVELLYLYCKDYNGLDMEEFGYFNLKNMGANVIQTELDGPQYVYFRSKHFNRKIDKPLGILKYKNKDENVVKENITNILGIKGESEVCFLKFKKIEELNFEINEKLYK